MTTPTAQPSADQTPSAQAMAAAQQLSNRYVITRDDMGLDTGPVANLDLGRLIDAFTDLPALLKELGEVKEWRAIYEQDARFVKGLLEKAEAELAAVKAQLAEMTARTVSLVMRLPVETLAGDAQKWRDEYLAESKAKEAELTALRTAAKADGERIAELIEENDALRRDAYVIQIHQIRSELTAKDATIARLEGELEAKERCLQGWIDHCACDNPCNDFEPWKSTAAEIRRLRADSAAKAVQLDEANERASKFMEGCADHRAARDKLEAELQAKAKALGEMRGAVMEHEGISEGYLANVTDESRRGFSGTYWRLLMALKAANPAPPASSAALPSLPEPKGSK